MIVKMIQYFRKRMEAQIKKIQRNIKHTQYLHYRGPKENREEKDLRKQLKDTMANLPKVGNGTVTSPESAELQAG